MTFKVARPEIIRAVHQRWLLNFWMQHLHGHPVPQWQSVHVDSLSSLADNLSVLNVIGADGATRFSIRYHGKAIGRIYGSADCRGRYLDEVLPPNASDKALKPYHQVLESGCPVYTIHDVTDRTGREVHFERLLLPFARDGRTVDRILASFEFFCPDGAFVSEALMKSQSRAPVLRLSATIEPRTLR
jgi:hypothetical protein